MSEQLYFTINAGRAKRGTPVLDSQPGAHTGASRKLIPGYSDSNIVFLNTSTGNDGNTGASIAQALLTYSAAATAAGSTKKIRLVNSATLSTNITKPTEATIGTTSTIASSLTAPVDTWTQAGTPSFSTTTIEAIAYSPKLNIYVAVGQSGKVATSPDGNTWTQQSAIFSAAQVLDVVWAQPAELFFACGNNGSFAYSSDGITWTQSVITEINIAGASSNINAVLWSDDLEIVLCASNAGTIAYSLDHGLTWAKANFVLSGQSYLGGCWASDLGKFFLCAGNGNIYYSEDASNWTAAATPSFGGDQIYWVVYSKEQAKLVAVGGAFATPKIAYSTDGDVWTQAGTIALSGARANYVDYAPEINKYVAVGNGGQIAYSTDGDTWTLAGTPSFSTTSISDVCWSPLQGKFISVGASGKIAYSTAYASTISADVAGFSIQAMLYSGTVTAYNCTLINPGTTASLSLENCRVEYDSHISNNAVTSRATLYRGDRHTTGAPASQDAISMTRDTVAGVWYIYNSSATGYEEIKDNIIEGGIVSSYAVKVTSGNTRGTSSGAVFSDECTQSDPKFVDETDYKLRREMDSYQYDSPLVAASQFYFNANGDARDLGAWSYNESTMEMLYTRHFPFLLPTGKDSFSNVLHSRVNRHVGEDGTPDVINDIDALWEEITLRYQTLPTDHIDFLDWWQGNFSDMTCEIDFFVGQPVSSTITVNGAHSAGDVTLTIDAGTTLAAGDRIFSGTEVYSVLYMVDDTLAVLSRKLAAGISDNAVLTISQPTGKGVYQYLPQADRDLRKPMGQAASEFDRGLVLNFSRKRV